MIRKLSLVLILCTAACGFFSRPKNQFYSLTTIPASGVPATAVPFTGTPIAIDSIELPPGLDRRGIVVRDADHKIEVRGTHQWTAPLEEMVLHTLAFDLANRLPPGAIILPGQTLPPTPVQSLSVIFEDLTPTATPAPQFTLDAHWTLNTSPATTHHERITVPMQSMESGEIARAMSEGLGMLAERLGKTKMSPPL